MAGGVGRWVVASLVGCLLAGCSGPRGSDAPSATLAAGGPTTSTTTPTTTTRLTTPTTAPTSTTSAAPARLSGVAGEVEAAYLRSWEVYADAMLRLDPARLGEVYAGAALETRRREVTHLRTLGTPGLMRVEHDYEVVVLNADDAFVLENYVNHSVLLDGTTMQPIEADPNEVVHREYVLRREQAGWRVAHVNALS